MLQSHSQMCPGEHKTIPKLHDTAPLRSNVVYAAATSIITYTQQMLSEC